MKKKTWIPRSQFFKQLKAGALPADVQKKYSEKTKLKSARRVKRKKSKAKAKASNTPKFSLKTKLRKPVKLPKQNFEVFLEGEQKGVIKNKTAKAAQALAEKQWGKKVLIGVFKD